MLVLTSKPGHQLQMLISEADIRRRVESLAVQIERDFQDRPLTVIGVLKGSVFFLVDLLRRLRLPVRLEFLRASSYGQGTVSSGRVHLTPLEQDLSDRDVLVVDDILDSGRTLAAVVEHVRGFGPRSIKTCVLVDKRKERAQPFEADYKAFEIPDVFIVGYGLDYAEQYRNLPYIASVQEASAQG
jgi:hypoxanthine phosphoribosyltransferase